MKKGFTLIELLAVIVILAIIAVIAVPIVLNIIDETKDNANKRSIDMYAKAVENAVASYKLNGNSLSGSFTTEDGKTVVSKNDSNVKLNVDYSGSKVVCETFNVYEDGKLYLSNCKVDNVLVNDYDYGTKEKVCTISRSDQNKYSVGDIVTCELSESTDKFYIIEEQPLTATHIQMLTEQNISTTTYRQNKEAILDTIAFSTTIYWETKDAYGEDNDIIKPIIDNYISYLNENSINSIGNLLTESQAIDLGCNHELMTCGPDAVGLGALENPAPSWVYSTNYWLGTAHGNGSGSIWVLHSGGFFSDEAYFNQNEQGGVRPVITISTSDIK